MLLRLVRNDNDGDNSWARPIIAKRELATPSQLRKCAVS